MSDGQIGSTLVFPDFLLLKNAPPGIDAHDQAQLFDLEALDGLGAEIFVGHHVAFLDLVRDKGGGAADA